MPRGLLPWNLVGEKPASNRLSYRTVLRVVNLVKLDSSTLEEEERLYGIHKFFLQAGITQD
jgi:hypothetical protein